MFENQTSNGKEDIVMHFSLKYREIKFPRLFPVVEWRKTAEIQGML